MRPRDPACRGVGSGVMSEQEDSARDTASAQDTWIERALDALNFFLADVRGGLGPYLAVYLLTVRSWNEAEIGIVMSISALAGILTQTPAGALIDTIRAKRAIVAWAALAVTAGSLAVPLFSSFLALALSQAIVSAVSSVFGPAVAAISLGIVGHKDFARRTGRNEGFNHAGNAVAATLAGGAALVWGPAAVFVLFAIMAAASIVSVFAVPRAAIDHERARGLHDLTIEDAEQPSGLKVLVTSRPLLLFAICAVLFHLANAAMLPLVGQKLALQDRNAGTSLMSVCIVAAQIIMVPMAILVGRKANYWGRKPLFLAGLLVLCLRGLLYPLSDNPYWLVGVQFLDGVGAGLYGALFPLIVADLMEGTGRFNIAQGVILTAQGIGASLSTTLAGVIVVSAGYSAAFLTLAAIAGAGFILYWFTVPETWKPQTWPPGKQRTNEDPDKLLTQVAE
jgi:MFS family permease